MIDVQVKLYSGSRARRGVWRRDTWGVQAPDIDAARMFPRMTATANVLAPLRPTRAISSRLSSYNPLRFSVHHLELGASQRLGDEIRDLQPHKPSRNLNRPAACANLTMPTPGLKTIIALSFVRYMDTSLSIPVCCTATKIATPVMLAIDLLHYDETISKPN